MAATVGGRRLASSIIAHLPMVDIGKLDVRRPPFAPAAAAAASADISTFAEMSTGGASKDISKMAHMNLQFLFRITFF